MGIRQKGIRSSLRSSTIDFDPTGTLETNFIACELNEIFSFIFHGLATMTQADLETLA